MAEMTYVQARTPETIKSEATAILERLGLNMSSYINMALNQLIIQEAIPFPVKLNAGNYTTQEAIDEVAASMRMEGMPLTKEDLEVLKAYKSGRVSGDQIRESIFNEVK